MNGISWIRGLTRQGPAPAEPTWSDVLEAAREEYGPRTTRYLADSLGVTLRTAQRYVAGQHKPTHHAVRDRLEPLYENLRAERQADYDQAHRDEVAAFLREIRKVSPGQIRVRDLSSRKVRDGFRNITEWLNVDLELVAMAWESGDEVLADRLLSDQIIGEYGLDGEVSGLEHSLRVRDYVEGIDYQ